MGTLRPTGKHGTLHDGQIFTHSSVYYAVLGPIGALSISSSTISLASASIVEIPAVVIHVTDIAGHCLGAWDNNSRRITMRQASGAGFDVEGELVAHTHNGAAVFNAMHIQFPCVGKSDLVFFY